MSWRYSQKLAYCARRGHVYAASEMRSTAVPESTFLSRSRLLSVLSSTAPLLVLQGNRYSGKTVLLRLWLRANRTSASVVAFVEAPARPCTADEYWTEVASAVSTCADVEIPGRESDAFETLCTLLAAVDSPVTLVLDGVEDVEHVEDGVAELLTGFPQLRVIVASRTHGEWEGLIGGSPDRKMVALASMPFTDDETSRHMHASEVPQSLPTLQRINRRTGGLPALVDAVRTHLQYARIPDIDELIDTAVDQLMLRTLEDPALAPMRREILLSSATRTVTAPDAFVHTLASSGMVDLDSDQQEGTTPDQSVWRYPEPVRVALRRLAQREYPDDVHTADTALIRSLLDRGDAHTALEHAIEGGYWTISLEIAAAHPTVAAAVVDAATHLPAPLFDETEDTLRPADGFYYLHTGVTYLLTDRMHDAIAMFRRAHAAGAGTFVAGDAAEKLALTYAMNGACTEAQLWLDAEPRHPRSTAGSVAAALLALDRLDLDASLDILTDLGTPADNDEFWAFALYAHGHHALLAGMPADGLRYIDSVIELYLPLRDDGISTALIDTVRADLHLACGNVEQAIELVEKSEHPLSAPVRARIQLLTDNPTSADEIVHSYITDTNCTFRSSLQLAVLGAAATFQLDRPNDARRHLTRAVTLSRRTGLLRPFALLPAPMLEGLASLDVEVPTDLRQMASQFLVYPAYRPPVTLTARERAVLEGLLAGHSTTAIAESQYVSVNTIKSQLRSLYRKLGAHSREEAIAIARRLSLA